MSFKDLLNQITVLIGGIGLTLLISVLLCFVLYQLAMRLYYMSSAASSPSEADLTSNKNMIIGGIAALTVVVSIAGIMSFAKDILTGIIK